MSGCCCPGGADVRGSVCPGEKCSASEATATWRFTNFVLYCIVLLYKCPTVVEGGYTKVVDAILNGEGSD